MSVPSQVQWQPFPAAAAAAAGGGGGGDGHVRSPNNNSDHATSASCVKVELASPPPSARELPSPRTLRIQPQLNGWDIVH